MKDFFQIRKDLNEAKFAGSNIKMPEQNDHTIKELSMKKKWKAGVQRALVGPSTKKKPLMFRTMGKDAKDMQKKVDTLRAVGDQNKNKLNIAKHVVDKMRKEEVDLSKNTLHESTDVYDKDNILITRFNMSKSKGSGFQINYGKIHRYIQVPEKDMLKMVKALQAAIKYK